VALHRIVMSSSYCMFKASFSSSWPISSLSSCLVYVVNLGNIDVMKNITKIVAVENATAIWEYDPTLPDNRVLGGSLGVILEICTLAIKIQASSQQIEYFHSTQICCGFTEGLKIPLHSNIRWGTAFEMLDQANKLCQIGNLFSLFTIYSWVM